MTRRERGNEEEDNLIRLHLFGTTDEGTFWITIHFAPSSTESQKDNI